MASLLRDVAHYEHWLRDHCKVVKDDLAFKHKRMREDAFVFLRSTYFRWARSIEEICPDLVKAPKVLCVGDAHVENFGTWRDAEGRQVWGANDFDEAAVMPYPFDLVRLLTSACLSPRFSLATRVAAEAILDGYAEGLKRPAPVLLEEGVPWFGALVRQLEEGAAEFWDEVKKYPDARPPEKIQRAMRHSLPKDAVVQRYATRRKGGGSLGRPRYVAIALWRGGTILREAKAMVPSAWYWAQSRTGKSRFLQIAHGPFRSPDPGISVSDGFLFRRVAPESIKLDLKDMAKQRLDLPAIVAMGKDIGSIHAAHHRAPLIVDDLAMRPQHWLEEAAEQAQQSIEVDYITWLAQTNAEGEVRRPSATRGR